MEQKVQPENAEELKNMVKEGRKFFIQTYLIELSEVKNITEDQNSEEFKRLKEEYYGSSEDLSKTWIFTSELVDKYEEDSNIKKVYCQVRPFDTEVGIVRIFFILESGELTGHNEVYPKAIYFERE